MNLLQILFAWLWSLERPCWKREWNWESDGIKCIDIITLMTSTSVTTRKSKIVCPMHTTFKSSYSEAQKQTEAQMGLECAEKSRMELDNLQSSLTSGLTEAGKCCWNGVNTEYNIGNLGIPFQIPVCKARTNSESMASALGSIWFYEFLPSCGHFRYHDYNTSMTLEILELFCTTIPSQAPTGLLHKPHHTSVE